MHIFPSVLSKEARNSLPVVCHGKLVSDMQNSMGLEHFLCIIIFPCVTDVFSFQGQL
jgi:hypothetical protein